MSQLTSKTNKKLCDNQDKTKLWIENSLKNISFIFHSLEHDGDHLAYRKYKSTFLDKNS